METASPPPLIDWGVAQWPAPGETVVGDAHVVLPRRHGMLLAVIDGSGHGREAVRAAQLAARTLADQPELPAPELLQRCHAALALTRGAVMTLAEYDAVKRTLTLCGVGNVEAFLIRGGPETQPTRVASAPLRGGIVGVKLPEVRPAIVPVEPGDVLVMASDGVRLDFQREFLLRTPPQRAAGELLQRLGRVSDDALVLVARFIPCPDE
jgi:serine phosphatase RsbU (regulator of sigma subunit)